ncbi:hypothetical protein WJX73_005861 [Symbiochloris irregularis]|uniref:Sel1 repeat family protein n=1 Tax=Symbiochloris irregularis TaxID=706552 RepID=A0AAW1P5Z7_9CHLO
MHRDGYTAESREVAAKYYRKAARIGKTGDPQGDEVVRHARTNLQLLAMTQEERAAHQAVLDTPADPFPTDPGTRLYHGGTSQAFSAQDVTDPDIE